jgi:16S rRNA (cytidine1402-2'-O)-methyltransferase
MAGTLYVVATPIGHLQDITLRAIETLKRVDVIACEDTRHTAILLKAHGIHTQMTSYHSYSASHKATRLLAMLEEGQDVAMVSDAGMPGISDPGFALIQAAIEQQIPVTVIPGPSASLTALVLSGFPTDRFTFEGFLPVKPGPRRRRLELLWSQRRTAIVYESPHRLLKTLAAIEEALGDIPLAISRELTKQFEETRRDLVSRQRAHFEAHPPRGEFVLVLPPQAKGAHGE